MQGSEKYGLLCMTIEYNRSADPIVILRHAMTRVWFLTKPSSLVGCYLLDELRNLLMLSEFGLCISYTHYPMIYVFAIVSEWNGYRGSNGAVLCLVILRWFINIKPLIFSQSRTWCIVPENTGAYTYWAGEIWIVQTNSFWFHPESRFKLAYSCSSHVH